jgi:hypothetical protein
MIYLHGKGHGGTHLGQALSPVNLANFPQPRRLPPRHLNRSAARPFDPRRTQFSASIHVESTSPRRKRHAARFAHVARSFPPLPVHSVCETGDEATAFPQYVRTLAKLDMAAYPPGFRHQGGLRGCEVAYDELVSAELALNATESRFAVPAQIGLVYERGPSHDCAVAKPS